MRALVACAILLASPAVHADEAIVELPRAPALVPEPVTEAWMTEEAVPPKPPLLDVFLEVSPLGFGYDDRARYLALARLGVGVLAPRQDELIDTLAIYAAYEISPVAIATFGLHAHYIGDLWGVGVGGLIEPSGELGGAISLRMAVLGLELQLRDHDGFTAAAYLTLEVPIRRIMYGIRKAKR